ncbi:HNH endonuclease [Natrialba asiatica]|uniref:HNH endonuclease n=1 Tax=Natrialba asiatica (strain ATCC 700177 / DSM 12278 / JCM 9576 / FERM P-10747 / NBRC 102637 / 172P1) TaxID=29540 RepID=M0AHU3_NATA1|nr:HNH endonuclease [Natrialba asiatica DSM 12278]
MSTLEAQIESRYDDPDAYSGNRPPDWEARRKMVYRHDNWTCQACGRQSGPHAGDEGVRLHAHHIVPLSKGGSNRLSNLETLCEPCHQTQHDHDIFTGDWVGDGPRVYTVGSLRATARGIFAALVIALWIVLVARLIALSGGYPPMAVGRETVILVGATLLGSVVIVSKPFLVTSVLGIVAAAITAFAWADFGLSPEFGLIGAIAWPPVILGAWAIVCDYIQ